MRSLRCLFAIAVGASAVACGGEDEVAEKQRAWESLGLRDYRYGEFAVNEYEGGGPSGSAFDVIFRGETFVSAGSMLGALGFDPARQVLPVSTLFAGLRAWSDSDDLAVTVEYDSLYHVPIRIGISHTYGMGTKSYRIVDFAELPDGG